jgi:hypothetical protein
MVTRQVSRHEDQGVNNLISRQEHPDEREAHQAAASAHDRRLTVRNFVEKRHNDYVRQVSTFTAFLGRSPDTATPKDLRRYQLHQKKGGVRPPSQRFASSSPSLSTLRVASVPDAARAVSGDLPSLSRRCDHPPVLTSSNRLSTRHQRFACAHLSRPCLPGSSSRLFRNAHHLGI